MWGGGGHFRGESSHAEVRCEGGWGVNHRWSRAGNAGELQLVAGRRVCLREREGEVKALAEALEGQERVWGEVACGHLTVGLLVAARWTLALEPADQQVDAGAAVLADSRSTAAGAGRQLAVLSWTGERWREIRINIVCDKQHRLSYPCGFHLRDSTLPYSFFPSLQLSYMCHYIV